MNPRVFRLLPLFLMLTAGNVFASKSSITIALDAVAIPVRDSIRVELFASIPSRTIGSTGRLLVSMRARDDKGHTLAEIERVEAAPRDTIGDRLLSWNFPGKPGKLKARVRIKTLDDSADEGQGEFEMSVPDFSRDPFYLSMPLLLTMPRDSLLAFGRPVPSRVIRSQTEDLAFQSWVLEGTGPHPRTFDIRFELRRGSQQVVDSTLGVPESPVATEILIRKDPRELPGGQYKFQITVSDGSGSVKREGTFQIAIGGPDLLRDPVLVRTVLGYIATGEERLALETASTDSLPNLWLRFWQRRDPSPGTAENEALERFLDRVERTEKLGGVVPGWRSDRGRILIQYGEPERTEEVFNPDGRTLSQIWYYDSRRTSYVFQDVDGFGNYQLVGGR